MILTRDEVSKVVCEFRTPISATEARIGTGIFVTSDAGEDKSYMWIVTASHVARDTNSTTQIVISTKEGKAAALPLSAFCAGSSWRYHPVGDVCAIKIFVNPINRMFLEGRFFPFDHFNLEHNVVSRDYELTSIGFPNGLGTEGSFSPLSFRSYAASGFISYPRADTKSSSEFFCLENPSVGGYSGCPVFDLGYSFDGVIMKTKSDTCCHGIMHGTMSDETGGKIAFVTPAFYLKDIIDVKE